MEEEYFLYNNTLYSKGDLSKKYGENVDQKISEFGFEKAYQYNDVVYSSSQLKSKYGDDYESVIETKGITPYGVKKKDQPQEEAITEDSSTVAEPLQESGGETEQDVTPKTTGGKIDYNAVKYGVKTPKKDEAGFGTAIWNSLVNGYTNTVEATSDLVLGAIGYIMPEAAGAETRAEGFEAGMQSEIGGQSKKILDEQLKSEDISEEDVQKYKEDFFGGAVLGLAESVYPMMSPKMTAFFTTTFDDSYKDISQKAPDLTTGEKTTYSAVQGGIAVALEKLGFRNLAASKSFMSSATAKVFQKAVEKAGKVTPKAVKDVLEPTVKGFLSEFETGAAQEAASYGVNQTVNILKDKDIFEEKSWGELGSDILRAGGQEGIGGKIMSAPQVASNLIKTASAKDIKAAEANNVTIDDIKTELENLVNEGTLTEDEASERLFEIESNTDAYNKIKELIPEDKLEEAIPIQRQYEAESEKLKNVSSALDPIVKENIKKLQDQLLVLAGAEMEDGKVVTKQKETTVEQKDDIERRRQEELEAVNLAIAKSNETGEAPTVNGQLVNKNTIKEINDKYNEELAGLEQRTTVEQYGDKKEGKISQEQFDEALNILEPIVSERREPTLQELEKVYEALGENASDVVDMAAKKDAVDLYNELTDKKKEYAKRNEGQPMRKQGEQKQSEGTSDSDMSKDDKAELQDGEKVEKEIEKVAKVSGVKAKNIKGLYDINRKMFNQNRVKSLASAVVMDRAIGQMAKRAGVPKSEMYGKIQFKKGEKAPSGALKQEAPIFKSTAQEGVGNIQQKAATPEQWVKMISDKGGKGTAQELDWIGLGDYLNEWKKENNAKSVPKEVVEQYINDNQIEIVEVSKGARVGYIDNVERELAEIRTKIREEKDLPKRAKLIERRIELQEIFDDYTDNRRKTETKYSQYTIEGGENYREVLLTLPNKQQEILLNSIEEEYKYEKLGYSIIYNSKDGKNYAVKTKKNYKSSHWDESNILAHLRINERTLPNGERVMFIEEVQSDWAQEGKKKGFKGDVTEQQLTDKISELNNKIENSNSESEIKDLKQERDNVDRERRNLRGKKNIPQMPYKKTDQWVGMAMRRALKMAADEGFDRVAWVTGEQSAERYDLSKQIGLASAIKNDDGTYNLVLEDTRGNELPEYRAAGKKMTPSEMEDTIGKELAQKLIEGADRNKGREWKNQPTNPEFFTLRGDGLKVGGEGMKAFYNSILPKVAKKEAQRFDKKAKVEVVDFGSDIEIKGDKITKGGKVVATVRDSKFGGDFIVEVEETGERYAVKSKEEAIERFRDAVNKQLSIPVTPEMRMNLNSAVPLFQGEQGAMLAEDGKYIIYALTNPNVSTPLHELSHVYEHYLTDAERKSIEEWSGHKSGTVEFSEKFARGFERYLANGKAPDSRLQKIFDKFKEWLTEIYNGIKGSDIDIELNDKMRDIYSKMLKKEETSKSQQPSSGAKKPQQKQSTAKTAIAEQKSKQEQLKEGIKEKVDEKKEYDKKASEAKKAKGIEHKPSPISSSKGVVQAISDFITSKVYSYEKTGEKDIFGRDKRKKIVNEYSAKQFKEDVKEFGFNDEQIRDLFIVANPEVKNINKKRTNAAKNIDRNKLGGLGISLKNIIKVPPQFMSIDLFDDYYKAINWLGQRTSNFDSKEFSDIKDTLKEVVAYADYEMGMYNDISEALKEANTKEEYLDSLKKMLDNGDINKSQYDFLSKNKPRKKSEPKEKVEWKSIDKPKKLNTVGMSEKEREKVRAVESVTKEDYDNMPDTMANYYVNVLSSLNEDFVPSSVYDLAGKIEALRTSKKMESSIKERGGITLNKIRDIFVKKLSEKTERRTQKASGDTIDSSVGMRGSSFEDSSRLTAVNYGKYKEKIDNIRKEMSVLMSSFGFRSKKAKEADIKVMMFRIQRQKDANKNSPETNSVKEFIDEMFASEKSKNVLEERYGKPWLKTVQEIYDKFKDANGELNKEKLYASLNDKEKKLLSLSDKLVKNSERFAIDAAAEHGIALELIPQYAHVPTIVQAMDLKSQEDLVDTVAKMMAGTSNTRLSTKSGTLEGRKKAVPIISFSNYESVVNGLDKTYKDYFLTDAIKTEQRAFRMLNEMLKDNKEGEKVARGISKGVTNTRNALLMNDYKKSIENPLISFLVSNASTAILGTSEKLIKESITNPTYQLLRYALKGDVGKIPKLIYYMASETLPSIRGVAKLSDKLMNNVIIALSPAQMNRYLQGQKFSGEQLDLEQDMETFSPYQKDLSQKLVKAAQIYRRKTGLKRLGEYMTSGNDQVMSRSIFRVEFEEQFKKLTGKKLTEEDYKKIANKNPEFYDKYSEQLKKAVKKADEEVSVGFTTTNEAQRSYDQLTAGQKGLFGKMRFFMQAFQIAEYQNIRKAIYNEGAKAIVTTVIPILARQTLYNYLGMTLPAVMATALGALTGNEDDKEDLMKLELYLNKDRAIKSLVSAVVGMFIFRDMSNLVRLPAIMGIELLNLMYGDKIGLREKDEDYNEYKDQMFYNSINLNPDDYSSGLGVSVGVAKAFTPSLSPTYDVIEPTLRSETFQRMYKDEGDIKEDDFDEIDYHGVKAGLKLGIANGILPADAYKVFNYHFNKDIIKGNSVSSKNKNYK